MKKNLFLLLMAVPVIAVLTSCHNNNPSSKNNNGKKKIGVLLVNHGSRSETWRNALLGLENNVKDSVLKDGSISGIKTAFMEYTEPSIATRLKEFDEEGYTDVVMVPVLLTVSTHSFDDIPTLIGMKDDPKSIELFKIEKMERYTPQARVQIAPLLDFTDILKKNVLRRFKELSKNPKEEGLVLIAYGDKTYNTEWVNLMQTTGQYIKENTGIAVYNFGWCGHIAHYSPDSTTVAVNEILKIKKKAVVIPVLVAFDETFQIKIIGGGISKVPQFNNKVVYKPDAVLPDKNVENWIIATARQHAQKLLATKD